MFDCLLDRAPGEAQSPCGNKSALPATLGGGLGRDSSKTHRPLVSRIRGAYEMDAQLEVERQLSASLAKLYGGAERTLSPFDSGIGASIGWDEGSPRDIKAIPSKKSQKKPISASRSFDSKALEEASRGGSPGSRRSGSLLTGAAPPPQCPPPQTLGRRRPSAPAIMMRAEPLPSVPEVPPTSPGRRWARLRNVSKLTFMMAKR